MKSSSEPSKCAVLTLQAKPSTRGTEREGRTHPLRDPDLQSIPAIPSDEKTVLGSAQTRSTLVAFKLRTDMKTAELGSLFSALIKCEVGAARFFFSFRFTFIPLVVLGAGACITFKQESLLFAQYRVIQLIRKTFFPKLNFPRKTMI